MSFNQFLRGGNLLTLLTIVCVSAGLGLGFALRGSTESKWSPRNAMYLKLPGDLFLRTLSCLILPLIFSTLVTAVGSLDMSLSKKIGLKGLVYYLSTSIMAAMLGTSAVHFIAPGNKGQTDETCGSAPDGSTIDTLLDLIRNIFPPNIVGAATQHTETIVTPNDTLSFEERAFTVSLVDGTNMLGIITFALVLGVTLGQMKEAGDPLIVVFSTMGKAMLKIARKLIWLGPLAAVFLIAGPLVEQEDISAVFSSLAWYIAVMAGTYLFHGFVILPILFTILTRRLPFVFIWDMAEAIFTAFGTASSSATLPITLKCLEEKHKLDPRITRFLIPIGSTVNMDGAAIGVPLRVIYIAQLCGRQLSFGELVTITVTSVAASVGLAGIPGVAMIVTMSVLGTIGIPTDKIAYVIPVDWLQDRIGTVINVIGDAYGAGIIAHTSKSDLQKIQTYVTAAPSDAQEENVHKERTNGSLQLEIETKELSSSS